MAFESYLIRKFEFTHENNFFRTFSSRLEEVFKEKQGEHFLLGNLSCNGHQMDAVFLSWGQITVIDFKDYEGELTFSENNPWRMKTPEGKTVFVQGGAQARNPFQQVRAYKFSLLDFLAENQSDFIVGVRSDINWGHISCLVLFQRKVEFNSSVISAKDSRYFSVEDHETVITSLIDKHSRGLELTDEELRGILKIFNVTEENLLDSYKFAEELQRETRVDAVKLNLIKRLTSGRRDGSLLSRAVNYYKTLINVERFKEPSTTKLYSFTFDTQQTPHNYRIDLSASDSFHQEYLENQQERFPKNVFIGLGINIDGNSVPLLHTILLHSDIGNQGDIEVDLDHFELYSKPLESMGLGEDVLEDLSTAVNEAEGISSKLDCIREHLDVVVEQTSSILISLSTESMVSIQLVSELNKLSHLEEEEIQNSLYHSFLFNRGITLEVETGLTEPFVQITELNKSQKLAVKKSFENPLTVVTGPPGTGKSQVVSNILANSVVSGYSTLFISKNNKAVDNVKERLDHLLNEKYLIRLGSKTEIKERAKPLIENFIARTYDDRKQEIKEKANRAKKVIKKDLERIGFLESELQAIPSLEQEQEELTNQTTQLEGKKANWLSSQDQGLVNLFIEKNLAVNAGVSEVGSLIQKTKKWEKGFLGNLRFSLFHKSNFEQKVNELNARQNKEIYELIEIKAPRIDAGLPVLLAVRKNLEYILNLKKEAATLNEEINKFDSLIQKKKEELKTLSERLNEIKEKISDYKREISELKSSQIRKGIEAVNAVVEERLSNLDFLSAQEYHDFLPASVWRDEDLQSFAESAKGFLKSFPAVCLTSLSIKNCFPLNKGIVDLLVIDEASQCDIASALPLIFRAKRVVVIGDPLQLTHITSIKSYEEEYIKDTLDLKSLQFDYSGKSLYDYSFGLANKSQIQSVFLQEHYRCHPNIINFSNRQFYEKKLGQSMKIRTVESQFKFGDLGMNWIHVNGTMSENKNINFDEANRCIELASELVLKFPDATIGIVTPFKDQYKKILELLPQELKDAVKVDTVHKYQGDEKDIMIFSTVVTENSAPGKANFINRNQYLINVAVTRARSSLYIVGNQSYCKGLKNGSSSTPLSQLSRYAEREREITTLI